MAGKVSLCKSRRRRRGGKRWNECRCTTTPPLRFSVSVYTAHRSMYTTIIDKLLQLQCNNNECQLNKVCKEIIATTTATAATTTTRRCGAVHSLFLSELSVSSSQSHSSRGMGTEWIWLGSAFYNCPTCLYYCCCCCCCCYCRHYKSPADEYLSNVSLL